MGKQLIQVSIGIGFLNVYKLILERSQGDPRRAKDRGAWVLIVLSNFEG